MAAEPSSGVRSGEFIMALLGEIFYQSLLRYIGCNAETHAMAALFDDEIAFRRGFALIDPS